MKIKTSSLKLKIQKYIPHKLMNLYYQNKSNIMKKTLMKEDQMF